MQSTHIERSYTKRSIKTIHVNVYLYINLRRSRDMFVPSFDRSFLTLASFRPAFTLIVHINELYIENVHGREEHATWINTIPLKIATLLNLQTLSGPILSGPMCSFYPRRVATIRLWGAWRAGRFGAWPLRYGMSVQAPIRLSNSLLLTLFITV